MCRSPWISSTSTRRGGSAEEGEPSRSSGGTNGIPSRRKTDASSAASGSGSSAWTYSDPRLGLRPDPVHLAQPAGVRRAPKLLGGTDVERAADLDRPLRPDPDQPAERRQLQRGGLLQLAELPELAGLDQLTQRCLDARS